ncbi:MAG TPA: glutathione S-transferase family protein [Candidatus Binatia bacterium]|nr:glutathione S-transferase family protein [Candidatus Binatia bacterium]
MKLYSGPLSLFTAKVRIALDEKGIEYELVSVPFSRATGYEPKHPEVVRLNPKSQVPVLVDGDLVLYDSTLILEYLEDRHPSPPLLPADPAGRARCRQLEAAADEILFPHVFELIQETFYKRDERERDGARIARAQQAIADHYTRLEATLDSATWLGGAFSIADIGYFLTVTYATNLGASLGDAHPKLQAWYGRTLERPAVQTEMTRLLGAARD